MVRLLLDAKADINKKDSFGKTVLWRVYNTEIFQMLLEAKADPLEKVDSSTLMHKMAGRHNTEIMQILLNLNVSISDRDKFGKTPLHYAAQKKIIGSIEFLLEQKANIFEKTKDGESVIDLAEHPKGMLSCGIDLRGVTVKLLETKIISAKQKQRSIATLTGLHQELAREVFLLTLLGDLAFLMCKHLDLF